MCLDFFYFVFNANMNVILNQPELLVFRVTCGILLTSNFTKNVLAKE